MTSTFAVLHNATMPQDILNPFKQTGKKTALLGFSSRSVIVLVTFGILLLAAIGIAIYFYFQYQQSQAQLERASSANEQADLLEEVGKLIVLPTDEQPQIATVSDIDKLKGQTFFAHAKNGDKVLIYTKAQEAILFDPVANKIISVGPVNLTQIAPTPTVIPVQQTPSPLNVALYNGTTTIGLTETISQELSSKMPNVTVIERTNARKSTYTATIVIDQTGKNATQAAALAKLLHGKVSSLPQGEQKAQNAELLVILGK